MRKVKSVCSVTRNLLLHERRNLRTLMGFLLGMAVPLHWLKNFISYAVSCGKPVNILEAFVIIEHGNVNILFLVAGWLLVISDAPFINENTYFSLYRTSRRRWNTSMLLYIGVQALIYSLLVALPMVLFSCPVGYVGKLWSSPVYDLATDFTMEIGVEYDLSFPWLNMMRCMNVPQAFCVTLLLFFLYNLLLGVVLYTFNLLIGGVSGTVAAFIVHISGYLLYQDHQVNTSLLACSIPANFIDGAGLSARPAMTLLAVSAALAVLDYRFITAVDLKTAAQGE